MDTEHQLWNERHKQLRDALRNPKQIQPALSLFLVQNVWVHNGLVSGWREKTFADAAWEGVTQTQSRIIPPDGEHSFVWLAWHMARIEDVTKTFS